MSPKRPGPRPRIDRFELLDAVDWCGVRWPLLFSAYEVTCVNEALDREILEGTVLNAFAVSSRGRRMLDEVQGGQPRGRLEVREDLRCLAHGGCLTIVCVRCDEVRLEHASSSALAGIVRSLMSEHGCSGARASSTGAGRGAVHAGI